MYTCMRMLTGIKSVWCEIDIMMSRTQSETLSSLAYLMPLLHIISGLSSYARSKYYRKRHQHDQIVLSLIDRHEEALTCQILCRTVCLYCSGINLKPFFITGQCHVTDLCNVNLYLTTHSRA